MSKHIITMASKADIPEAARKFIDIMGQSTIFAFNGEMGAGKTTFITELCRQLGVSDDELAGSPSFSIVNEYRSDTTAELIYHFDLYRLESLEEAFDIGIEDYFDSGALCLLEWPERIADILPDDTARVNLTVDHDTEARTLTVEIPD